MLWRETQTMNLFSWRNSGNGVYECFLGWTKWRREWRWVLLMREGKEVWDLSHNQVVHAGARVWGESCIIQIHLGSHSRTQQTISWWVKHFSNSTWRHWGFLHKRTPCMCWRERLGIPWIAQMRWKWALKFTGNNLALSQQFGRL